MPKYSIEVKQSVVKDLRKIQQQDQKRILKAVADLGDSPRPAGCKKLSGAEKYRIRVGQYRVLYEIRDAILVIVVVKVSHRRQIYR